MKLVLQVIAHRLPQCVPASLEDNQGPLELNDRDEDLQKEKYKDTQAQRRLYFKRRGFKDYLLEAETQFYAFLRG